MLLDIITITITWLKFLFVLYYWSSYLSIEIWWRYWWNGPNSSTTIKSIHQENQWRNSSSCSLVFCVLPRHTNIITEKGFNLFYEYATRCVHLFPQEELCTSFSWGDSKMYTSSSLANSQRMLTKINKRGAIVKIRVWLESDTLKH